MSGRAPGDDEVDRLLREVLADDLPPEVEAELRREARLAWRAAASGPPRVPWPDWLGIAAVGRALRPQPALVAAALAMLGAGVVMQAAPLSPAVLESFRGHEASALTAQALGRARAMECAVDVVDRGARRARYRVEWRAPGEARVRFEAGAGPAERLLRFPGARPTVLTPSPGGRDEASLDPALEPIRAYLSAAALGARLASGWRPAPGEAAARGAEIFSVAPETDAPRLTVAIDPATRLPVRLDAADRDGGAHAAVCRWR